MIRDCTLQVVLALVVLLAVAIAPLAAQARPPTVSNWAGYNRRLEESRQALQPPAPATSTRSKRHGKTGGTQGAGSPR